MEEQIKNDLAIYLSCNPDRVKQTKMPLLVYPVPAVVNALYLPKDAVERFRVYDLCYELGKPAEHLLNNIYDECRNTEDPLSQLSAIEFIHQHNMYQPEFFIQLFKDFMNDPLLIPTIATATVPMLLVEPEKYEDFLKFIIDHATTDMKDLLGTLPDIARNKFGTKLLLDSQNFKEFISEMQHDVELRTMNFYIRTLMIRNLDDPKKVIVEPKLILRSLNNPAVGLRVACLEHVAAAAKYCLDNFLQEQGFVSAMCDVTMDTTIDEEKSRLKAQDALGISLKVAGSKAPTQLRKEAEPELMVI
ncbi:hypothetical protein TVAG_079210 [Trichomonas vaginalis G3]|uniref:Uncharacterized protein n=1 Tax=Trichomonas vaginalis (strain ATCC PRA-98 / G3) TaxID=412133 RepID=A2EF53_TRIV3|nr:hypothetical protein TVAGG3_1029930 [Trichomonas vaginalis G3]EAY08663.1 hypothetical protein TVAG_079210 [Trichomonas vaginalis G3]KAI5492781.1 hypothetical protein TVAGG3_1029930 [Trichomonas vaginalis G3]|eukprot:XP_001320886.1 hypothetical protein [Trichomonas vaginalis G3]